MICHTQTLFRNLSTETQQSPGISLDVHKCQEYEGQAQHHDDASHPLTSQNALQSYEPSTRSEGCVTVIGQATAIKRMPTEGLALAKSEGTNGIQDNGGSRNDTCEPRQSFAVERWLREDNVEEARKLGARDGFLKGPEGMDEYLRSWDRNWHRLSKGET